MACPSRVEIVRYVHNELPPEETDKIARHVAACVQCNALAREMRACSVAVTMSDSPESAEGCPPAEVLEMLAEGALPEEKAALLAAHLSKCNNCLAEIATIREMKAAAGEDGDMSPSFRQKLLDYRPAAAKPAVPASAPASLAAGPVIAAADRWKTTNPFYKYALIGVAAALLLVVVLFFAVNPSANKSTAAIDEENIVDVVPGDDRPVDVADDTGASRRIPFRYKESRPGPSNTFGPNVPNPNAGRRNAAWEEPSAGDWVRYNSSSEGGSSEPIPFKKPEVVKNPGLAQRTPADELPTRVKETPKPVEPAPAKDEVGVTETKKPAEPVVCLNVFGGVEIAAAGNEDWRELSSRTKLKDGFVLRTKKKPAYLIIDEKLSVLIDKKTKVSVLNRGGRVAWGLDEGEICLEAAALKESAQVVLGNATVSVSDGGVHVDGVRSKSVTSYDGGCGVKLGDESVTVPFEHRLLISRNDTLRKPRKHSGYLKPKWTGEIHLVKLATKGRVSVGKDGKVAISYGFGKKNEIDDFEIKDSNASVRGGCMRFDLGKYSKSTVVSRIRFKGDLRFEYGVGLSKAAGMHSWFIEAGIGGASYAYAVFPCHEPDRQKQRAIQRQLRRSRDFLTLPAQSLMAVQSRPVGQSKLTLQQGKKYRVLVDKSKYSLLNKINGRGLFSADAPSDDDSLSIGFAFQGSGEAAISGLTIVGTPDKEWLKKLALGKARKKMRAKTGPFDRGRRRGGDVADDPDRKEGDRRRTPRRRIPGGDADMPRRLKPESETGKLGD